MDFTAKYVSEVVYLGWDFTNRLNAGETITGASFSNVCMDAADSLAPAMVTGSLVVGNLAQALIANGTSGNTYELTGIITTSGSRTLEAQSKYRVK